MRSDAPLFDDDTKRNKFFATPCLFLNAVIARLTLKSWLKPRSMVAAGIAATSALGLVGCGGGGFGEPVETSKDALSDSIVSADQNPENYLPNYVPNLAAARRWNKSEVTVSIVYGVQAADAGALHAKALLTQGIDLWNQKVGDDIRFKLIDSTDSDIKVRWAATGSLPSDAIGRTEVRFRDADQMLVSASVEIEQSLPDDFQVQVIAHELGHALGIEGHSQDATDLMYPHSHLPAMVTRSDQNTVLWRYNANQSTKGRSGSPQGKDLSRFSSVESVCRSGN